MDFIHVYALKKKQKTNLNVIQEKVELKNLKIINWAENPHTIPMPGFLPALLRVGDVVKSLEL